MNHFRRHYVFSNFIAKFHFLFLAGTHISDLTAHGLNNMLLFRRSNLHYLRLFRLLSLSYFGRLLRLGPLKLHKSIAIDDLINRESLHLLQVVSDSIVMALLEQVIKRRKILIFPRLLCLERWLRIQLWVIACVALALRDVPIVVVCLGVELRFVRGDEACFLRLLLEQVERLSWLWNLCQEWIVLRRFWWRITV